MNSTSEKLILTAHPHRHERHLTGRCRSCRLFLSRNTSTKELSSARMPQQELHGCGLQNARVISRKGIGFQMVLRIFIHTGCQQERWACWACLSLLDFSASGPGTTCGFYRCCRGWMLGTALSPNQGLQRASHGTSTALEHGLNSCGTKATCRCCKSPMTPKSAMQSRERVRVYRGCGFRASISKMYTLNRLPETPAP